MKKIIIAFVAGTTMSAVMLLGKHITEQHTLRTGESSVLIAYVVVSLLAAAVGLFTASELDPKAEAPRARVLQVLVFAGLLLVFRPASRTISLIFCSLDLTYGWNLVPGIFICAGAHWVAERAAFFFDEPGPKKSAKINK